MIHPEAHPLSNMKVKLVGKAAKSFPGETFTVEGWMDRLFNTENWIAKMGNPAILDYIVREGGLPNARTEAVYGKIGYSGKVIASEDLGEPVI